MFLIRAGLILLFLFVFLYIILPDLFKKKSSSTIEDIENESKSFAKRKQAIRGATKKTQQKIDNINKNIEK